MHTLLKEYVALAASECLSYRTRECSQCIQAAFTSVLKAVIESPHAHRSKQGPNWRPAQCQWPGSVCSSLDDITESHSSPVSMSAAFLFHHQIQQPVTISYHFYKEAFFVIIKPVCLCVSMYVYVCVVSVCVRAYGCVNSQPLGWKETLSHWVYFKD